MHILIVTPKYYPLLTGNTITAERLRRNLTARNHTVTVSLPQDAPTHIRNRTPDIIHLLHATKSIVPSTSIPTLVTLTGTDVNVHLHDPTKQELFREQLSKADAVSTLKEENLTHIEQVLNITLPLTRIIPQSVWLPPSSLHVREKFDLPDKPLILLPASIREVKDPFYAVQETRDTGTHLLILGEVQDDELYAKCQESYVTIGKLPHEEMQSAYTEAALILNTSHSEGQSNAILEAYSLGKIVLASDVVGNEIVPSQYRFSKEPNTLKSLILKTLQTLPEPVLPSIPTPDQEAAQYEQLYRELLDKKNYKHHRLK